MYTQACSPDWFLIRYLELIELGVKGEQVNKCSNPAWKYTKVGITTARPLVPFYRKSPFWLKALDKNKPKGQQERINGLTWKQYYKQVWDVTAKQDIKSLPDAFKREFRVFELDHKVSVWHGWTNGFPAQWIGELANLRFIPAKQNTAKGKRSVTIDFDDMIKRKNTENGEQLTE